MKSTRWTKSGHIGDKLRLTENPPSHPSGEDPRTPDRDGLTRHAGGNARTSVRPVAPSVRSE
ncbi:hypothetical protein FRACA_1360009 [Frankia canadensis]|uniref:Uncharacterized protein n=1 Tax=Frankia canadensis TaxID=1836972 RepID=A0A2I2KKX7_9ACTN|nr:hypothetical protein FRACA_1360009 [Frankia canadensis]SOU53621.1 hypothetical protein FRACA_1360009 [Frankia canadensis]